MKESLDRKICEAFPKLFRDSENKPIQSYGFECGDGWFNLIYSLCGAIQKHIDSTEEQRSRAIEWNSMLDRGESPSWFDPTKYPALKRYDVPELVPQVTIRQVKEKFGSMRVYINGGDNTIRDYIDMVCYISDSTCELCGGIGEKTKSSWVQTLCKKCAKKKGVQLFSQAIAIDNLKQAITKKAQEA